MAEPSPVPDEGARPRRAPRGSPAAPQGAARDGQAPRTTIEFLAQTGDAYKAMVRAYLQVKWRRRNSHAKLTLT